MTYPKNVLKKSKGQSLAEYGLILALIAVASIIALTSLGGNISTMMNGLSTTIGQVNTAPATGGAGGGGAGGGGGPI
jgi:pilus assembly protein Flp/PilA